MRLNKFIALSTGMGRRPADAAIAAGRVQVNGRIAAIGQPLTDTDTVMLDGRPIGTPGQSARKIVTIMLNKPAGYVVSRDGQGSQTIYDLLPPEYHQLKPAGRLDKYSSGLLLLTNDGQLAFELTHPSRQKMKVYEVTLSRSLQPLHRQMISDHGLQLDDGLSRLQLDRISDGDDKHWLVTMHEGRNRQIRRTFAALGYSVTKLHRIQFGAYKLNTLASGEFKTA